MGLHKVGATTRTRAYLASGHVYRLLVGGWHFSIALHINVGNVTPALINIILGNSGRLGNSIVRLVRMNQSIILRFPGLLESTKSWNDLGGTLYIGMSR